MSSFPGGWLLAVLLLAPFGSAAPVTVWTDPEGDVQWNGALDAQSGAGPLDLQGLEVDEQPEGFRVLLDLAQLDSELDAAITAGTHAEIPLDAAGQPYVLSIGKGGASVTYYDASLVRLDGDERTTVWYSDTFEADLVQADRERKAIAAFLPRDALAGPDGLPLARGATINVGQVLSGAPALGCPDPSCSVGNLVQSGDAMPDQPATATLAVQYGDVRDGLVVHSLAPFRASNGEAATFAFAVTVENPGPATSVVLDAAGPGSWTMTLPVAAFDLAAGANRTVPVLATTPFAHQHGGIETIAVEARRLGDPPGRGETVLGIRYLPVPQPAGHHDTLYLHSRQVSTGLSAVGDRVTPTVTRTPLTMNALLEDPADTLQPVDGRPDLADPAAHRHQWFAELAPGLGIGLDLDLARTGELQVPLLVRAPLAAAQVEVRLVLRGAGGEPGPATEPYFGEPRLEIATGGASLGDLLPGSYAIEVAILPQAAGDLAPFVGGSQLILEITLTAAPPVVPLTPAAPAVEPGGWLRLPLLEYADATASELAKVAGVAVTTAQPVRQANPGETLVWEVTTQEKATLSLVGPPAGEARLLSTTQGTFVVFRVPPEAADGDLHEMFVVARADDREGVLKLVAQVDEGSDHPDQAAEAARLEGEAEAPGLGLLALLVALAALVALRRR